MIRAAMTGPMPGTVRNSFSVAVLMSMFPWGMFSFACDLFMSTELVRVIDAAGFATGDKTAGDSADAERDRVFPSATKELKDDGAGACAFNRPALTPQPPIFSRFAASSNC